MNDCGGCSEADLFDVDHMPISEKQFMHMEKAKKRMEKERKKAAKKKEKDAKKEEKKQKKVKETGILSQLTSGRR